MIFGAKKILGLDVGGSTIKLVEINKTRGGASLVDINTMPTPPGAVVGGDISGGAFNPAVSIAMMYAGKMPRSDLIPYIVAQVAGGLTGFELFKMVVNRQ